MVEILTDTLYAFGLILVLFNMVFSIYRVLAKRDWQYMTRREFLLTVFVLILIAEFFIQSAVMIVNLIVLVLFIVYLVLFVIKERKVSIED